MFLHLTRRTGNGFWVGKTQFPGGLAVKDLAFSAVACVDPWPGNFCMLRVCKKKKKKEKEKDQVKKCDSLI